MNAAEFSNALGKINDKYIMEAIAYERKRKSGRLKWGAMAACFGLILTMTMITLPGVLRGQDSIVPSPDPDVPEPVISDDDTQPSAEQLQPPSEKDITIIWDNVAVNESSGMAPDTARLYRDPALYESETWGEEEIVAYYGWNLTPNYIPEGLSAGGRGVAAGVWREKATSKIIEEQAGQGFWTDFWEDGCPKSSDDLYIPTGFTIRASKLGILHCGLLQADEERTTDFGGVSVTITHCSMKHGPYDPTQKAPDGLSNMPAGYYDIYVASFTLDGVEYEIEAQRLELEELIKIVASVINVPYSENFTVGNSQNPPDKSNVPAEYPDTAIVPGFDLSEPGEPDAP